MPGRFADPIIPRAPDRSGGPRRALRPAPGAPGAPAALLIPREERHDRDEIIRNDWHVVYRSRNLDESAIQPIRLLGEDLVLWRSGGVAMAWLDLCIHRGSRFSMGRVHRGEMSAPITAGATTVKAGAR